MGRLRAVYVIITLLLFPLPATTQELPSDESAPLVLVRIIPIPGVMGRFDHMAVDNNGGRVFAAVYGNDSVEVLDTARGTRDKSIHEGFIKPQMVAYLPDMNRIVVSSEGDGSCKILDATSYKLIDTVKFSDDADQLRYDPVAKRVMDTGKEIASLPGAIDTDDMSFDQDRKRIYVTSGEGFIFVYQQLDPDRYERIAKIPTTIGARTSSYTGQVGKHNSFYLAVPARADRGAELWVYETRD